MSAKHTPGPWRATLVNDTGWAVGPNTADGPDYVADVHMLTTGRSDEDSAANARLIAAAPELLDALRALVSTERPWDEVHDQALRAIAKAEGR